MHSLNLEKISNLVEKYKNKMGNNTLIDIKITI